MALIVYKTESDILRKIKLANQVSLSLSEIGYPTRKIVSCSSCNKKKIVRIEQNHNIHYCCIYNYLPGKTISWENYTQKHLKLLGQVLGLLHTQLSKINNGSSNLAEYESRNLESKVEEMNNYFLKIEVREALEQKLKIVLSENRILQLYKQQLALIKKIKNLSQQLLHLDFVRGNILFKSSACAQTNQKLILKSQHNSNQQHQALSISGILDFEKCALGPPILDVARTLAFLLVDCKYKASNNIIKDFLHSGYIKRGKQPTPNEKLLGKLVRFYLFQDFYQFLLHNPYESLDENEHFVKTSQLLSKSLNFFVS